MVPRGQAAKEVEINGVCLEYIEQGSGEPMAAAVRPDIL